MRRERRLMKARNVNSKKYRSTESRRARTGATSAAPRATRIGKVREAFWLDPRLVDEAREALGVSTEREAVEMALDWSASGDIWSWARGRYAASCCRASTDS